MCLPSAKVCEAARKPATKNLITPALTSMRHSPVRSTIVPVLPATISMSTSTPHGTLQLVRELAASFHQPPWSTRAVRNWLTSVRLPKSSRRVSGLLRRSIAAIYFSSFHPCVPAPKVPSGFVLTK